MNVRDDDGSIPLVLTVTILVGGIVAALVATVIGTQRSVTFDRNYTEAITAADAGLQQALTFLAQRDGTDPIGEEFDSSDIAGNDTIGSGSFEWTARKDGPLRWEVRAAGTAGEETRVLESTISADSDFFLAAFSDLGIEFRGGNGASSYPDGGNGAIGSNNAITMNGNSFADFIFLYGNTASCDGNGCDTGTLDGFDEQLDMEAIRATVDEQHAEHCAPGDYAAWTASSDGTPNASGVIELQPGDVICATNVDFDTDVVINGPDVNDPVKILLTGDLNSSNHLEVNCPGCGSSSQPVSGGLQIYSTGSNLGLGNHNSFAAATLAPNASCGGRGNASNAQTDYFGSLICQDISNQGGWQFHFDEALLQIGAGRLDITSYREESTASSSFDWTDEAP